MPAANYDLIDQLQPTTLPVEQQTLFSAAFLEAFESSGCLNPQSGWLTQHLTARSLNGAQEAFLPLYLKQHSYGEYVFDWLWADASERAGLRYYPKLISAIPYTPCPGPRLGLSEPDAASLVPALLEQLLDHIDQQQASSWHLLFADRQSRELIQQHWPAPQTLLERFDCQYHWFNRDYTSFDDFLAQLRSQKRKSLKRERRKIEQQGLNLHRLSGAQISDKLIDAFYDFYALTYHQRGRQPYLNRRFFEHLRQRLADKMLLVAAVDDSRTNSPLVGCALFLFDQNTLYGRWWGGLPGYDCLHFEACYYQGIEFAIERGLQRFDPGTQGEHKLIRGFEPIRTCSLHWLRHPGLHQGVERWLAQERRQVEAYIEQARGLLPYRQSNC
ncbi:N-acetyltransferase [Motiliproteus coralliicola]|uniref:N-acetyltransferase n=1 Tax=Motiliproteus coralliicola TaxID=2283196 RepID=A0A369WS05_9GAMM|nr:GNAT family N-acetyltransferase [Motiliproteus coralliicola]RDE24908.1 N-acetyltransferase [Motiliproteus coralliicola]